MYTLNCRGRLIALDRPRVMGILNVTPDSFYAGSRYADLTSLTEQARQMIGEGATMLDIGGQSTRPGAEQVGAEEEAARVVPAIRSLREALPEAVLSVDTFYASVARAAVEAGADIVNDVSGGTIDEAMLPTVAALRVPYVCMHMRGTPGTMQTQTDYDDVVADVLGALARHVALCREAGIADVIADPGFGFAKNIDQNFELLRNLDAFAMLQCPMLVGVSRKSSIYRTLGVTADEALNGTTVLHTFALTKGAHILRVHDVREAVEAVILVEKLLDGWPVQDGVSTL